MPVSRACLLAALLVGCTHVQSGSSGRLEWMEDALSYRSEDIRIILANDEEAMGSAMEARQRWEVRLAQRGTTAAELIHAVRSTDEEVRQAAAVLARVRSMAKGEANGEVLAAILSRLSPNDRFFVRYYGVQALVAGGEDEARALSGRITSVLLRDGNDIVRLASLPLIPWLREEDGLRLLAQFCSAGGPRVVKASYAVSRSVGSGFACKLRQRLTDAGDRASLDAIDQMEEAFGAQGQGGAKFECRGSEGNP